jgi:hypothetical protein
LVPIALLAHTPQNPMRKSLLHRLHHLRWIPSCGSLINR